MTHLPPAIAVFGSSLPIPGDPLYRQALETGAALGAAGWSVVTGGYGGVMQAASEGCRGAGGHVVGVTCEIFPSRTANRWVQDEAVTSDLHERTRVLLDRSDGFVVLNGKAGTLAEISLLWALDRAGCLASKPVVAVGHEWAGLLRYLGEHDWLEPDQLRLTLRAETPLEVVALLRDHLPGGSEDLR